MAKQKSEKETYQQKADFYQSKKVLIEERISLLKGKIDEKTEEDRLKVNTHKMEVIDLEASLEGIVSYWDHYMERLQAIEAKEASLTKECEENFKRFYEIFTSISPANIKQHSSQIQEQYNNIIAVVDKEWGQKEKNALYSLMKDLLQRMKKI